MTVAICYKCGATKWGAFCPCGKCKAVPQTEDDFAMSLAMTDHYFKIGDLEATGRDIAIGKPVHLHPETKEQLVALLRQTNAVKLHQTIDAGDLNTAKLSDLAVPKKKWFEFWKR